MSSFVQSVARVKLRHASGKHSKGAHTHTCTCSLSWFCLLLCWLIFGMEGENGTLFDINIKENSCNFPSFLGTRFIRRCWSTIGAECTCLLSPHPPQNPYTDEQYDTRNIVCVGVSVVVEDRQDMPPVFYNAQPVTRITSRMIKVWVYSLCRPTIMGV